MTTKFIEIMNLRSISKTMCRNSRKENRKPNEGKAHWYLSECKKDKTSLNLAKIPFRKDPFKFWENASFP